MKVTKRQLRRIIREEKQKILAENRIRRTIRRALLRETTSGSWDKWAAVGLLDSAGIVPKGEMSQEQWRALGSYDYEDYVDIWEEENRDASAAPAKRGRFRDSGPGGTGYM